MRSKLRTVTQHLIHLATRNAETNEQTTYLTSRHRHRRRRHRLLCQNSS